MQALKSIYRIMSLEEDLFKDLDSDSDIDAELQERPVENTVSEAHDKESDVLMDGAKVSVISLERLELDKLHDLANISQLPKILGPMIAQIDESLGNLVSKKDETEFLLRVNDLAVEISNEITTVHRYIKIHYGKRFAELELLIPNPIEYSKVVKILGNTLEVNNEVLDFISREKILVLTMSSLQAKEETLPLPIEEIDSVLSACDLLLSLDHARTKVNQYISSRLAVFAPNLSAIVGATTAAQFMNVVGGLDGLAKAQPRNIPSMGNRRSTGLGFGDAGSSHQGYLYHSPIIQQVSPNLRVQAMRKVSAKIVLAARFDVSGSASDGSYGEKLKKEINENLEKLEEPPTNQATKALPIPKDRPAKKRAGRKLRKLKQRYEASDYRKLQNRVEFGRKESTVMDAYGEEVGLGMTGSMANVPLNNNTRAKLSKNMKSRLANAQTIDSLFNQDLINLRDAKQR